ncbi:MAG: heme-copper oxidase subunit III [Myxococcota bacterium]
MTLPTDAAQSEDWNGPAEASPDTKRLGMKIFMASWTFSFVALLVAYVVLRFGARVWPPDGLPHPPLVLTGLATFAAIGSSVVLQLGVGELHKGRPEQLEGALGFASLLGVLFLGLQTMAGVQAWRMGLEPNVNAYTGIFWVTAVFHALHVLVGVGALMRLWLRARSRGLDDSGTLTVELWTYFWHSIDLAWLAIFAVMFLPY